MNSTQRAIIAALSVTACLLLALVAWASLRTYQGFSGRALGAPLPTSAYTPLALPPTWTPVPALSSAEAAQATAAPIRSAPLCGGPEVMMVLLIGSDTRSTGYTWGLADVVRLARVDFVTPRLTVLDFPRDLWVEIPEIADNLDGQDHEKLNQSYLYGNPGDGFGYWDHPSAGPGLLAQTLDLNFGAKSDHYLAVNMQTFVRMVDTVGGLDITLDHAVAGSDNRHLQPGRHHLNGSEALAVARDRSRGVFDRDDNQNLVLCAFRDKLTSPAVLPKIPELIRSFQGSVQTDLDVDTSAQLACLASRMPIDNIAFYSFPEDILTGTRIFDPVFGQTVFAWEWDVLLMRGYVAEFAHGNWPLADEEAGESSTSAYCD